jgi:FAD/FMN-containing dehydrogenase
MHTPIALLLVLASTFVKSVPQQQHEAIVSCLAAANVPQDIPGTANFTQDIIPYNLRLPFTPVALAIPSTVAQVQAAVSCAARLGVTVNPRSGGHSYASHDIGGEDGHLVIDLKLFYTVMLDNATNIATIGPGARLGNVALGLFDQGGRAISHGVCPG